MDHTYLRDFARLFKFIFQNTTEMEKAGNERSEIGLIYAERFAVDPFEIGHP